MNVDFLTNKKIWLAPLAGITDKAFRTICKECGADVMVSEMVSADGLVFNKEKSIIYADFDESQRPFGIQIFGSDPEIMAKAAKIILEKKPNFIDINMGCPVKKVVKRGAGSALMKTPKIATEIVKSIKSVIQEIPLSVKFRAGWDFNSINAIEFGMEMEKAGADILCLHSRTKSQMFSGKSDWKLTKLLKENVKIPVIGNGDIFSENDGKKMYQLTNCDSVMIGRGIMGKPWLFREMKDEKKLSSQQKFDLIKKHYELTIQNKGEHKAMLEMRTHILHYTKGLRGGKDVRKFVNQSDNKIEILKKMEALFQKSYG